MVTNDGNRCNRPSQRDCLLNPEKTPYRLLMSNAVNDSCSWIRKNSGVQYSLNSCESSYDRDDSRSEILHGVTRCTVIERIIDATTATAISAV